MDRPFRAVYYLNLARRRDRLGQCRREFEKLGWSDCRRIEAVDSATIDVDEWIRRGAVMASAASEEGPAIWACVASHYLVWSAIADSDADDDDWILILEDDFRPHPVLAERPDIWRAYWGALPPDAGFVFMGWITYPDSEFLGVGEPLNRFVVRLHGHVYGSHAYAVTRRFVRSNLAKYFPMEASIDCFSRKLSPLYALRRIDDSLWRCETPPDFYRVERQADGEVPLTYSGLISVHPSPSDIQYSRVGIEAGLAEMQRHMQKGQHERVRRAARQMKPVLMKQRHEDLYLRYLDVCITSFWFAHREEGRRYARWLLDAAANDPLALDFLRSQATRLVGNLRSYSEDYANQALSLLGQDRHPTEVEMRRDGPS
jgi:hypothetical protein